MGATSGGATARLAEFIQGTAYRDIPEETIERAKLCLLDWIGCAYAGLGHPSGRIVSQVIGEAGGKNGATLLGSTRSGAPADAALYNGVISAVVEMDDVHEEASLHTSIGVIPAALAVAEYAGVSGKDLLAALVVGYDLSVRVARVAGASHYQFWHTTGTCNTFGAAAAAGKLLGLDGRAMTMALGLAGTQAAGLWDSLNEDATMAKHLHSGKAAANGILAALLARAGFVGSDRIIEGPKGFLAASSGAAEGDKSRLTGDLGQPFLIMRNFFKRHACCRAAFEGIEGLQLLLAANTLQPEAVEKVKVTMRPARNWLVSKTDPRDIYQAKFSLPFCMAVAALYGDAGLFRFTQENLRDPAIRAFMRKVTLVDDPAIASKARVEVTDKGGTVRSIEPVCRTMSREEVLEKFRQNMSALLDDATVRSILSAVEGLDELGHIGELTRILTQPPSGRIAA